MRKKRIATVLSINVLVLVIVSMVMVVAASAADSTSNNDVDSAGLKAPSLAGGITVTLLNVSAFPPNDAFYNGIAVYYDHNQGPQTPFFGGGWIGVNICNNEAVSQSVAVQLADETGSNPFPAYTPTLAAQNAFMLGKGQNFLVTVPDIPAGACQISYHYIFTPRFKDDPAGVCEIWDGPSTRGACGQQEFYVDVVPAIGGLTETQTVSGTLVMDRVQTANPGAIEKSVESSNIFTLTVFFESGNLCTASGSCAGTYAPTTHYDYDASVMHLIRISGVATDTNGTIYSPTNVMRLEAPGGVHLNQDPLKMVYVFDRDKDGGVIFHPSYAANSGADNYKGTADEEGVPTAITLQSVSVGDGDDTLILALASVGIVALVSAMIIWRRRQQVNPS
ncbi:MAG TPA: hypothetical protein VFI27_02080 [candidate division Zixibacteria bacterium]|nr:hypothetical protein [candidate division Zixibacteria bacterium]